jgi:peptide/nickel transport system permease protein
MKRNLHIAILAMLIALCAAGPLLAPYNPLQQHREMANAAPSARHWLGTDDYGRDVLSRFLAGANWSVPVGEPDPSWGGLIPGLIAPLYLSCALAVRRFRASS